MKVLEIGGKNYTFEFSIEASLYNECTEKVVELMSKMSGKDVKAVISGMSNVPKVAIAMAHAGLLEHHSEEIMSENDTKALIKQYLVEHKDDENGNFYSLMEIMFDCMGDDGFFKLIGLETMSEKAVKEMKKPQDHKKPAKATKN